MNEPFLKAGAKLWCQNCGEPLYELTQDIHLGDLVEAHHVKPVGDIPQPKAGDAALCPKCHGFLNFGQIYRVKDLQKRGDANADHNHQLQA